MGTSMHFHESMPKVVDKDHDSRGNQHEECRNCRNGVLVPTGQRPQPYLDNIDHREHQEHAAQQRPGRTHQYPEVEQFLVDVGLYRLIQLIAVDEVDVDLETLSHQRGEEEEAEGEDLEQHDFLGHIRPCRAVRRDSGSGYTE
ncbi:hypothetical protein SAY86_006449 [Trapa natans]|uniref:Uncharacterized protein n=1 Tax=Trapa natans TaxID=22666 RepID=A0AAN7QW24_TRANT|nr:hypothetical protein SAY86_006449 [Trapa natans]